MLRRILQDKKILIAGYGREGKSSHALLQKLFPGKPFDIAQNNEEIHSLLAQNSYDLILKSPGIPTFVFEGHCDLDIISSQTDLFLQAYGNQTIGISGTKGKSTTTSLIYHSLQWAVNTGKEVRISPKAPVCKKVILAGNIGIPLFDILDQINDSSIIVAEFSCHQLENIHRGPHIGILLNLFQEHLDHYHDYMGYKMAKMQMALRQIPGDHFFYSTDNVELADLVSQQRICSQLHPYALKDAEEVASLQSTLQGDHNRSNILVVWRALQLMQMDKNTFANALAAFSGLPHRLERVGEFAGITFYNDSISTIPAACEAAVKALGNVDTLILGGFDRGIDYAPLAAFLDATAIRNLVFVGKAGSRIHALLQHPEKYNILLEDNYEKIVPWCFEHTAKGSICLLSPAAASYDAFKNFEHRGETFKRLVVGSNVDLLN